MSGALQSKTVGFIGCGAMASALAGGLARMGIDPQRMQAADPLAEQRESFESRLGISTTANNAELVNRSDLVALCVKPAVVPQVLGALGGDADRLRPLWISIAAGVRLATLEAALPEGARIIRAMPNTPALVGRGATAYCSNPATRAEEEEIAEALFGAVGIAWRCPEENLLDAVTGLSGSGPAYVFLFLESLIQAGTEQGLPGDAAKRLALQTVLGAAELAAQDERSPAALREQVSSPGGTTVAGLAELASGDLRGTLSRAVAAATRRSQELSEQD